MHWFQGQNKELDEQSHTIPYHIAQAPENNEHKAAESNVTISGQYYCLTNLHWKFEFSLLNSLVSFLIWKFVLVS